MAFAFRVRPYEPDDDTADDDPMAPKAGFLDFQTVAITAADDWVIIAWHSPTRATGAGEVSADRDWAKSGFEPGVKARWLEGLDDGDDIAMAFMDELLDTVAIARRSMFSWLEAWEIDFSRRLQATETGTLLRIRGLVAEPRAHELVAREPFLNRDTDRGGWRWPTRSSNVTSARAQRDGPRRLGDGRDVDRRSRRSAASGCRTSARWSRRSSSCRR